MTTSNILLYFIIALSLYWIHILIVDVTNAVIMAFRQVDNRDKNAYFRVILIFIIALLIVLYNQYGQRFS